MAMAEGPSQFQYEFNKIAREMVGEDEELYQRVQNELAGDVSEAMIASQLLASGHELTANQEVRWFGPILGPLAWVKNWSIYQSINIPVRLTIKLLNKIAWII